MTEHWRPVVGHPDYEVSSLGRVLSHKSRTPRLLRGVVNNRGYRVVNLSSGSRIDRINRSVHILVTEAFHGPRPAGMQVRHLDGDQQNNSATNLAWGTASENIRDQVRHGTHHVAKRTHCPQGHPYTPDNTYLSEGHRRCRACTLIHVSKRPRTKRGAA